MPVAVVAVVDPKHIRRLKLQSLKLKPDHKSIGDAYSVICDTINAKLLRERRELI